MKCTGYLIALLALLAGLTSLTAAGAETPQDGAGSGRYTVSFTPLRYGVQIGRAHV